MPAGRKVYLAGPDVFLPNAPAHAERKRAICARHGLVALAPLNEDVASLAAMPEAEAWRMIFAKDMVMMASADLAIVNLTPFRGPSADAGTLVELGWFLGAGKQAFGYSNSATLFAARNAAFLDGVPDTLAGLSVGGFGLADNLMIPGALERAGGLAMVLPQDGQDRAFDALDVFERCVVLVAARLASG